MLALGSSRAGAVSGSCNSLRPVRPPTRRTGVAAEAGRCRGKRHLRDALFGHAVRQHLDPGDLACSGVARLGAQHDAGLQPGPVRPSGPGPPAAHPQAGRVDQAQHGCPPPRCCRLRHRGWSPRRPPGPAGAHCRAAVARAARSAFWRLMSCAVPLRLACAACRRRRPRLFLAGGLPAHRR
jgi:hypothetical protein